MGFRSKVNQDTASNMSKGKMQRSGRRGEGEVKELDGGRGLQQSV